jgi:hypothetical protein
MERGTPLPTANSLQKRWDEYGKRERERESVRERGREREGEREGIKV